MRARRHIAIAITLVLGSSVHEASSQIQIEPGVSLQVLPFSSEDASHLAFPPPGDPTYTAFFYATRGGQNGRDILAYDANGIATLIATVQLDGGQLDFGRGSMQGRVLITEAGQPGGLAADGVYELLPSLTVAPFNLMGGGNPDPNDVEFPGGSFGDAVYAANPTSGSFDPDFNRTITKLTTGGSFAGVFHSDSRGPYYMAASSGGPFGEFLYTTYIFSNAIDRIAPDGTATPFATIGANGLKIEFGQGGYFGADLYATNLANELYRIDAAGVATKIASGLSGQRWAFDPASGDLFARETPSGYVRITGTNPPTTYCTAKTSSAGCVAQIATSDANNQPVSGANDYAVTTANVQELKNGLLFAGISGPANLPFSGGILCVQPPTKRGPIMSSGGSDPNGCNGSFATLVNDGNVLPAGLDAGPGNTGWYQYWYRDPMNGAGSFGTALSDAVELTFD